MQLRIVGGFELLHVAGGIVYGSGGGEEDSVGIVAGYGNGVGEGGDEAIGQEAGLKGGEGEEEG